MESFSRICLLYLLICDKQWKLPDAIGKELGIQNEKQVEALLNDGKLLVLMDGFDEVPTQALRTQVQRQLSQVAKDYSKNRYIMTCRTQIMEAIPDGFVPVEVSDFSVNQVRDYVSNWFRENGQNEVSAKTQWQNFELAIDKNPALRELTVTPVLLGLMCLILQDEREIPAQTSLLYERGIRLLLSKWNDGKLIPDWEMGTAAYRGLDVEQKENLLIQIAARKFEHPENFVLFEQNDLLKQISQYLKLSNKSDAQAVLRAIESQHGLLIERADELWSFSHLTFQMYFTTKWLLSLPLKELSQTISDEHWQEGIVQVIKIQGRSDRLLRLIKHAIDYLIDNPQLQALIAEHQKIDYRWNVSNEQNQLLHRYNDANKFLVKLLKIKNAVSPEVRQEIEDNLLLPIAELKRRLPDQYGRIEES
jgi:predicted NACHT family NTPase